MSASDRWRRQWGPWEDLEAALEAVAALEQGGPGPLPNPPVWWRRAMAPVGDGLTLGSLSRNAIARLLAFRRRCEAQWGQPVSDFDAERLPQGELFCVYKALALRRLGRTPAEVTEGFLTASAKVAGRRTEPREIFWQRFRALGAPNGHWVVVCPDYPHTSRTAYPLAHYLNGCGYEVLLVEPGWAVTAIRNGEAFGGVAELARDVAAAGAYAASILARSQGGRLILLGDGLGASAGVLGAAVLSESGVLRQDGMLLPRGVALLLRWPFVAGASVPGRLAMRLLGRVPGVRRFEPAGTRQEVPSGWSLNLARRMGRELEGVWDAMGGGHVPMGPVGVLHLGTVSAGDASRRLGGLLGSHVLHETVAGEDCGTPREHRATSLLLRRLHQALPRGSDGDV